MQPKSTARLPSFRSTPASWLESVLLKEEEEQEEEEEEQVDIQQAEEEPLTFTQLLSTIAAPSPSQRYDTQDYPPTTMSMSMSIPNSIAPKVLSPSPFYYSFSASSAPLNDAYVCSGTLCFCPPPQSGQHVHV